MNESFSQVCDRCGACHIVHLILRPSRAGPITHLMRKCASCDYLLFGDGDTCNRCGAALPRVTAGAATMPAGPPTAAAPAAPAPAPAPAPRAPSPEPVVGSSWRDRLPSAAAARPAGGLTVVGPIKFRVSDAAAQPRALGDRRHRRLSPSPRGSAAPARSRKLVLVILVALGAGVFKFMSDRGAVPAGTSEFAAGKGIDYTSPDRSYTACFPKAPAANPAAGHGRFGNRDGDGCGSCPPTTTELGYRHDPHAGRDPERSHRQRARGLAQRRHLQRERRTGEQGTHGSAAACRR